MATFHSFDEKAIASALEAAQKVYDERVRDEAKRTINLIDDGHLCITAQCISVTVEDGKVCLNLPYGFGKYCFVVPSTYPNGTVGQACLKICTFLGLPTGVRATVAIAGNVIVEKVFGRC